MNGNAKSITRPDSMTSDGAKVKRQLRVGSNSTTNRRTSHTSVESRDRAEGNHSRGFSVFSFSPVLFLGFLQSCSQSIGNVVLVVVLAYCMMWNFASSCIAGNVGLKNDFLKQDSIDCSDDEVSSVTSREEGLECPICWESFNLVENIPYVLWCGHTLCKNCILGLQWAVVKCPTLPLQLPLFISCPWCNLLSLRLVYRGNLKFPRKNFFLLWMLESMNGDRVKSHSTICGDHQVVWPSSTKAPRSYTGNNLRRGQHIHHSEPSGSSPVEHYFNSYLAIERLHSTFKKSLIFFVHLTAKFPLVIIFLLIILYAIPASAAILALYILITVLFALPSFLILYFAYPSLDWLVREIIT